MERLQVASAFDLRRGDKMLAVRRRVSILSTYAHADCPLKRRLRQHFQVQ